MAAPSDTSQRPPPTLGKRVGRAWRRSRRAARDWLLIRPGFLLVAWILPRLSRKAILRLATLLGGWAMRISGRDRGIALANADLVYGDTLSAEEKRALIRTSFRTMALTSLDVFWFSRDTAARLEHYAAFDEYFDQCLTETPSLFVTAHYGNWEVMGLTVAHKGYPVTSVAKPLRSPWVNQRFIGWRQETGQKIVPVSGAMRGLVQAFKKDEHVALLLDQNTFIDDGGIWVDFFDRKVPVAAAAATLALRFKVTVKTAFCWCDDEGVYHADIAEIPPHDDPHSLTQAFTRGLEEQIRRRPGNWLWMYKRWRSVPEGADRSHYPAYADPTPQAPSST